MKIVIPADGADLDAPTSPVFGRCQTFMFVDSDTFDFLALSNPARDALGGAGVEAVQLVLQHGAEAVIARRLGPNAFRMIRAAGIPAYVLDGATVRETVRAFQARRLVKL
jgi:predicted Fe-Mo cluster-binding NifX family protein